MERKCSICKTMTEDYIDDKYEGIVCSECQEIDFSKTCNECRGSGGNCPSCGGSGHRNKGR